MTTEPDWRVLALLAATPVSRTWQVEEGGSLAVLRKDEPGARRLGLNRAAEPDVLRAAAAAGLGPACRLADPAAGLLLTDWLPGRAWTASDLQEPDNLRRAASLLRRVHATPLAGPVVDLGAAIDRYAAAAGAGSAALAATARQQLAQALAVGAPSGATPLPRESSPRVSSGRGVASEGAPARGGLCFCHNDPTPGNFIAGPAGGLHLIDWEYAGLCHPGFDLAGLAVGAALTEERVNLLLQTYRGRPPTGAETDRHRDWSALCASLGELWARAVAAGGVKAGV